MLIRAGSRGVQGLPRLAFPRGHKQICARAGDVVILNYSMAHTIAPNVSPQLRYNVYFRISSHQHRKKKAPSGKANATTGVATVSFFAVHTISSLLLVCGFPLHIIYKHIITLLAAVCVNGCIT